ncbi:MAG: hypothetical protein WAO58_11570 [Fimbriimonadaceae bacterium]
MLTCPGCKATLPTWATKCQFCGADVASVPRPRPDPGDPDAQVFRPNRTWVMTAYYAISIWYIVDGLRIGASMLSEARSDSEGMDVFSTAFAVLTILIGIGLLLRVELVRAIVVFFAALGVLFGILGVLSGIMGSMYLGIWGLLGVIFSLISIAANALMIYLIGETETRGPNF